MGNEIREMWKSDFGVPRLSGSDEHSASWNLLWLRYLYLQSFIHFRNLYKILSCEAPMSAVTESSVY